MAGFTEPPKTTDPLEILRYFQDEAYKPKSEQTGIASKPKAEDSTSSVMKFFADWWTASEEKVNKAREELAPTMETLARESALLNAQEREAAGITQSLVEGGSEAYRKEPPEGTITRPVARPYELVTDTAKDVEESAPVTAETESAGLMSPVPPEKSLRPRARPIEEVVEEVSAELPSAIATEVSVSEVKTPKDVNMQIFDATSFSGSISTPEKGADPIKWIAENSYGLNENDPAFRKAMKAVTKVDPKKTPWCAAFAAHVLKGLGVSLPDRARQNPNLAFNYIDLGEEVYNHNPTTGKTYAGSLDSVKAGDVVVFNNGGRAGDGSFKYGEGHISFVVGKEEDGSIIAVGGNQGGGTKVTTTRYTPEIIKKYYKGGFTVRRINDGSLENTDPSVIAAITKDISVGGAER